MHITGGTRMYSSTYLNSPPYSFPLSSLLSHQHLAGVGGVYMLISNLNPSSFYIGSSIDLYRRINEYSNIANNTRSPHSRFENMLASSSTNDWTVMIMTYTAKHLVLVEEQLAICNYLPPLNRNHKIIFNYWLPGFNLNEAIALAIEYQNLFEVNSISYDRFARLIECFKNVQSLKQVEDADLVTTNIGKPVFVYDHTTTEVVAVYSSINRALKALNITQEALYTHMNRMFYYIMPDGQKLVFSLIALTSLEIKNYIAEIKPLDQMEFQVTLTDQQGVIVATYPSLREFCLAHNIDLRKMRRMLPGLTVFNGYNITITAKSRRIAVYSYDPDTQLRAGTYSSMTAAHATVNMRYGTFKKIVETNGIYNNILYSFSDTYPTALN